jgi:hypothetical protein
MIRDDLSNKLIHLTSDNNDSTSVNNFLRIINSGILKGGSKYIKGGFKCICFSETPISKLGYILAQVNSKGFRYSPFGFMFDKRYMFELGARPVIYQTDNEFDSLPESIKYRHVRFDPSNGIDFTWEREWRLKIDSIKLDPDNVSVIIPKRKWIDDFKLDNTDFNRIYASLGDAGRLGINAIPWHFIALEDLGF